MIVDAMIRGILLFVLLLDEWWIKLINFLELQKTLDPIEATRKMFCYRKTTI